MTIYINTKNYLDKFIRKTLIYLQYFKPIHNISFVNSTFPRRKESFDKIYPKENENIFT